MAAESRIAVIAAFFGNLIIAILKLFAGLVSNSAAMLAESAHSFSDVGNQVLLLIGIQRSNRPPTTLHPFGSGKSAYFWPFLVAVLLFGVAGAYSVFEGIDKILHPHEVGDIRLSLAVLAIAFVIEAVTLGIAIHQARRGARRRGIRTVGRFIEDNRDATLLTVLVEDALALFGLVVAAVAITLTAWTGDPLWDGLGSLAIGALLMGFALFLAHEVRALLIGVGLSASESELVRQVALADPAVDAVLHMQSMYLGGEAVLLGLEVDLVEDLAGARVEAIVERLETALQARMPHLRFVYIEPRHRTSGAQV